MNRKVSVVGGAGNVGATVARAVSQKELADVVIVDIADTKAAGIALDIYQSCAVEGSASRVLGVGTKDFAETANSDVVVITSGMPRKPGMSRDDLLNVNYKIMQDVTAEIVKHSPNCIIVPVANPLDAMSQAVFRLSKFPRERVVGMAGRARLRSDADVRGPRAQCLGFGRHVLRARRPRRHDGATAATVDGRRHSADRAREDGQAVPGEAGRDLHADGQRRRRDHETGRHERVVRSGCVGRRHGGSDPEGSEAHHAVLGVPAGRIRDQRPLRGRAGEAGRARRRRRSSRCR